MKTKLVLWGTNEKDERVLIAVQLRAADNKVDLYTFPEKIAGNNLEKRLMDEWRLGKEVEFPEGHDHEVKELSISESLLPDRLKVERGDIIQRAQTEWHFVVLSAKLNDVYRTELAEIKEKIESLTAYDSAQWETLKSFWNKVQGQIKERNLFREHGNSLRETTNSLFDKLKKLRATLDEEFQSKSKEGAEHMMNALGVIEKKIADGLNLQGLFNDLKNLQREFKDIKLTREHRNKVWERLDKAFKQVKEKRFGPQVNQGNSPMQRLKRRYEGLLSAIEKMQRSIKRDKGDLEFQGRRIENSEGQLEAQIRMAKTKMIEERIRSKEEKLAEMMATKIDLEKRIASQEVKDKAFAEKAKLKEAQTLAKSKAKEKIAAKIEQDKVAREGDAETLAKAASALKASKSKKAPTETPKEASSTGSMLSAVGTSMGEALEDVIDTVKAVAEVVSDKVEDAIEELKEAVEEGRKDVAAAIKNEEE